MRDRIARPDIFSFDENEIAEIFYTSGSTGTPKGVMLSHRTLYVHALGLLGTFSCKDTNVELHTIPLFHANGWGRPQSITMSGAKHVMVRRFEPAHGAAADSGREGHRNDPGSHHGQRAAQLSASWASSIPRACKVITMGGAASSPELIARLEQAFHCEVCSGYGLTETCPVATTAQAKAQWSSADEADRLNHSRVRGLAAGRKRSSRSRFANA